MSLEYENIRSAVDSLLQVNSTLKRKKKTVAIQQKEVFVSIINALEQSQIRSNLMFTELKLDLSSYDEMYLQIIDSLLLLSFGKGGYELISFYLYDRNNPDGSNNTLVDEEGNDVKLETAHDLWELIQKVKSE
jgi:hypothetical protein